MLAPGRSLAVAVYRPLAEQLVSAAGVRQGDSVLELSAGDGELTARLQAGVGTRGRVEVVRSPWELDGAAGRFDLAVSLLALDTAELPAVLPRLAARADRVRVVTWSAIPQYEAALAAALGEAAGEENPAPVLPAWQRSALADVARFDGVGQLLMALTDERGLTLGAENRQAVAAHLGDSLRASIAADGTMRIPVSATLWSADRSG